MPIYLFIYFFKKKLTILASKAELFEFYKVGVVFFFQIILCFLFNKTFSEKKIFGVVGVNFFLYAPIGKMNY